MSVPATPAPAGVVEDLYTTPSDPFCVPPLAPGPIALSVVVPTREEAEAVRRFLPALHASLEQACGASFEIIVVDDDSADRTWHHAALLPLPRLRVLRRHAERGPASAVFRGWQASRGRLLATINADFQHPPELPSRMLPLARDCDLVVATRYCASGNCGDWSLWRRFASRIAYWLGRALAPRIFGRVSDPLSGCYLLRRDAVAAVLLRPTGYKSLIEVLARGRVRQIAEVGYTFASRRTGRSKASIAHVWKYVRHLATLRHAPRPVR